MKTKIIYNYITTNKLNGKQYIGMHSTSNVDDSYLGSGMTILNAITKYGKSSFIREILCVCQTLEEANKNEKIFIEKFNTLSPNGYNISPTGGVSCMAGHHSEETKLKIAKVQLGRKHTEEHKRKNGDAHKGQVPWMKGRHHSEDSINRMKEKLKGQNTGPRSEEVKRKVSESLKGNIPWNKGIKGVQICWNKGRTDAYSQESRNKMSESMKKAWERKRKLII